MCTVLLPPGGYPTAVKYIISYHIINTTGYLLPTHRISTHRVYPVYKANILR